MPVADPAPLLRVRGVSRSFGAVHAVREVSLDVARGGTVGVVGPNGAGKSTLFKIIAGHVRNDTGTVSLRGRSLDGVAPHRRAALGVGLVFQAPKLFSGMTIFENVQSGAFLRSRAGFVASALRAPRHFRAEATTRRVAAELLERYGLGGLATEQVAGLPFGLQRRVAVVRALAAGSELLLLDEPAAGLTGGEREDAMALIAQLRVAQVSVLLIEHDVRFVGTLADTLVVMAQGAVIATGEPAEVLARPDVVEVYSGVTADA